MKSRYCFISLKFKKWHFKPYLQWLFYPISIALFRFYIFISQTLEGWKGFLFPIETFFDVCISWNIQMLSTRFWFCDREFGDDFQCLWVISPKWETRQVRSTKNIHNSDYFLTLFQFLILQKWQIVHILYKSFVVHFLLYLRQ